MKDFLVKHCINGINNAFEEKSKLNEFCLKMEGLSSAKGRHLLNNLCNFQECKYFEVGSFLGSTLCSAAFENSGFFCGMDDFSETFQNNKDIKVELFNNIRQVNSNISFAQGDFFNSSLSFLKPKINVFFYDGIHRIESQYLNLFKMMSYLDDYFIYIVDDYFCDQSFPKFGCFNAISKLNLDLHFYSELSEQQKFHAGMGIFVLQKK